MSADRDDLARAIDPAAFEEHPIEAKRPVAALQWAARRKFALDAADAALTWFAARAAAEGPDVEARDVERLCEVMHDAYEAAATEQGWETQARSRKPWSEVPEANKATMRVAVRALLAALRPAAREVVETAECSYCFKRPAVGETPDGDSICEECAVPMADVAETLRMAAQIVERFAAETYPADVFPSPTREAYAAINRLLMRERGHALDGVGADCYRRALANAARLLRDAADDPDLRS